MLTWVLLMACSGGDKSDDTDTEPTDRGDADTDTDTDTDTDADADSDADSDADADTDTPLEPDCDDAATQPLTVAEFDRLYEEKYCWWWEQACGLGACPGLPSTPPDCPLQTSAACACLDGPWTCYGSGISPAPACAQARDCWVDPTGETADSGTTPQTSTPGGYSPGGYSSTPTFSVIPSYSPGTTTTTSGSGP